MRLILLSALVFVHPLFAQESGPTLSTVRLNDLIQEALANRPSLKAEEDTVRVREAQIGPQSSLEDPVFGFAAVNYPIDSFRTDQFGMTGNEFSLTQKIPFPGRRSALKTNAKKEFQAAEKEYANSRLELIREVKIAFFKLYLSHEKKRLLSDQLTVVRSILSASRSRYTTGKLPQAELLSAQVEEARLLDDLITADEEINVRIGDLNHAVGRPEHHAIGQPEDFPKANFSSAMTEESLGTQAVANNPQLASMKSMIEASEAKISYAKRGYYPDFEFRVAYTQRSPSPGDPGTDFFTGGVGLSLPLWANSKQSEIVAGARAENAKWKALYEEERLHLLHEVHTVFAGLVASQKRLELLEKGLLPLSDQALRSGQSAYLTDKLEYATLLNLLRNRFQTHYSYSEARVDLEIKISELETLLGGTLETKS